MQNTTMLVIGSTGKTGRRISGRLADLGYAVRHGPRSSSTPFDRAKRETWHAALEGVQAAYISYFPDLPYPGAKQHIEALTKAAVAAGVNRLVLFSGRGELSTAATAATWVSTVAYSPNAGADMLWVS